AYATAVNAILPSYASRDPKAMARLLDESGPAVQARAAMYLVQNWVQQDPAAAARWAATIADETVRNEALERAAQQWARRDAPEAERWARTLANATTRDAALRGVFAGTAASGADERPPTGVVN